MIPQPSSNIRITIQFLILRRVPNDDSWWWLGEVIPGHKDSFSVPEEGLQTGLNHLGLDRWMIAGFTPERIILQRYHAENIVTERPKRNFLSEDIPDPDPEQ